MFGVVFNYILARMSYKCGFAEPSFLLPYFISDLRIR